MRTLPHRVLSNLAREREENGRAEEGERRYTLELMDARFLNGLERSMNTMPMLKICTPPPDMYSMNACMGRDFAGENARSQARFVFSSSYDAVAVAVATDLLVGLD